MHPDEQRRTRTRRWRHIALLGATALAVSITLSIGARVYSDFTAPLVTDRLALTARDGRLHVLLPPCAGGLDRLELRRGGQLVWGIESNNPQQLRSVELGHTPPGYRSFGSIAPLPSEVVVLAWFRTTGDIPLAVHAELAAVGSQPTSATALYRDEDDVAARAGCDR